MRSRLFRQSTNNVACARREGTGGSEVQVHSFSNSALDWGEQLSLRPGRLICGERAPGASLLWAWDEQHYRFGRPGEQKIPPSCVRNRNTILLPASSQPSHYTDYDIHTPTFPVFDSDRYQGEKSEQVSSYNPNKQCSKSNRRFSRLYFKIQSGLSST